MQIKLSELKYQPERHPELSPESLEEERAWALLDAIDEALTAFAFEAVTGIPIPEEESVPPGPPAARRYLSEVAQAYMSETHRTVGELLDEDPTLGEGAGIGD